MTVPPDTAILRFIFWLVNTPGLGGVGVVAILVTCLGAFAGALRWIVRGATAADSAAYAYPTPALHEHD